MNRATAQHGYLHHYPKCGKKSAETINTKFSIVQLLVEGFVRHKRQHFHCNWQQGFWWMKAHRQGLDRVWGFGEKCNFNDA